MRYQVGERVTYYPEEGDRVHYPATVMGYTDGGRYRIEAETPEGPHKTVVSESRIAAQSELPI